MKLATELSKRDTGRTFYILDEPTTGLHFEDVRVLLEVLHRLVDRGNTVLVIEHNLDVIKTADWIIDLGPEGGTRGGNIVAQGTPEDVAQVAGVAHGPLSAAAAATRQAVARQKVADKHMVSLLDIIGPVMVGPSSLAHGGRVPARAARARPRGRHAGEARASSCTAPSRAPAKDTAPTRRSSPD